LLVALDDHDLVGAKLLVELQPYFRESVPITMSWIAVYDGSASP